MHQLPLGIQRDARQHYAIGCKIRNKWGEEVTITDPNQIIASQSMGAVVVNLGNTWITIIHYDRYANIPQWIWADIISRS